MMKNIIILGSTGSIGTTTVQIVNANLDSFCVYGLSSYSNYKLLAEQANQLKPKVLCIGNQSLVKPLQSLLNYKAEIVYGQNGLVQLASASNVDLMLNALVGSVGFFPTLAAIEANTNIALANKETLVVAGSIVMDLAKKNNVKIIPVDSEHNAIYQCLKGNTNRSLSKIVLTASGGPLLNCPLKDLPQISPEQALAHPTWGMGKKISIDSATMVNKCLEIIEAKHLFNLAIEQIDVLIHPQSIVHGMIEFSDASCLAMLGPTTMSIPIVYSLYYPDYSPKAFTKSLLEQEAFDLKFMKPDLKRFPILTLIKEVAKIDGTAPAVFNAANEIAVQAFLDKRIRFDQIIYIINKIFDKHVVITNIDINVLMESDKWARKTAEDLCNSMEVL